MKRLGAYILSLGGLLGLLLAVVVYFTPPEARAEPFRNLPFYWGTIDGSLQEMTITGVLRPTTTLSAATLGDSTHRYAGSYINTATGATINCTNSTLTSVNVGIVYVANMSGNHTLTLPTAASAGAGARITLVDACGKVASTGNFTVNVTSSGNINGGSSMTVDNATYEQATFISNGSAWFGSVSTKTN